MVVGRLLFYWEGNFSGAMLNFRGVSPTKNGDLPAIAMLVCLGVYIFTVNMRENSITFILNTQITLPERTALATANECLED